MPHIDSATDRPLLISSVLTHAEQQYGDVQIVSRETHGELFRYTYADAAQRARRLVKSLGRLGLGDGDVVGSIAWNNYRHLEGYFAVSGSGMVMHTCNPRLQIEQLAYIINHADDRVVLFDSTFSSQIASGTDSPNIWIPRTSASRPSSAPSWVVPRWRHH